MCTHLPIDDMLLPAAIGIGVEQATMKFIRSLGGSHMELKANA
jgi:hypothetical protein